MRVKLVRDKIGAGDSLELVQAANSRAGKMLGLYLKLHEEAQEIAGDPCNPEEYADLLEVITELMRMNGVDRAEVARVMHEKREHLGGFSMGRILRVYRTMCEKHLRKDEE